MAYTMEDRVDAINLAREIGYAKASRKLRIPAPTLYRWNGNVQVLQAAGLIEVLSDEVIDCDDEEWEPSLENWLVCLEKKCEEQQNIIAEIRKMIERHTKDSKGTIKDIIDSLCMSGLPNVRK